ncbi:MAG: glycosyltransferase [Fidelibacterota bacterium]
MKSKSDGIAHFQLDPSKRTILVFGGSQGSRPINMHILKAINFYGGSEIFQLLWQTGYTDYQRIYQTAKLYSNIKILPFIQHMEYAYAIADLAVCRSGAMTVAELIHSGVPSILIPLPHAAAGHQEYNAMELEKKGAALVVFQRELPEGKLEKTITRIFKNPEILKVMKTNLKMMERPGAAERIVTRALGLLK